MGDIDHRGFQFVVQLGQFQPHLDPQQGVKVGQRFVKQEHLGVADQGAANGDALALTARKLGRAARHQLFQLQQPRNPAALFLLCALATPASDSEKQMFCSTVRCG